MADTNNADEAWENARLNLLNQLASITVSNRATSEMTLNMAEAYAWLTNVSQPHGGRSSASG